jgi:hypothetical protein
MSSVTAQPEEIRRRHDLVRGVLPGGRWGIALSKLRQTKSTIDPPSRIPVLGGRRRWAGIV